MAPAAKANYKSYEAQARLVRAIVAAHPEVKWNYKEIVACFGSDMSEDALNHRWRRLRAETTIIREGRAKGLDLKHLPVSEDLPKKQGEVDKKNISKYFGQSTPDGVQFQFRTIKKDADHLRRVEAAGGDVANCLASVIGSGTGAACSTPVRQHAPRHPRGSGTGSTARRGTAKRPAPGSFIKRSDSDIEDDDDDDATISSENWSAKDVDVTPSKRPKIEPTPRKQKNTPSRHAATKASATIAADSQQIDDDDSDEPAPLSIFGNVEISKPAVQSPRNIAFNGNGHDEFFAGVPGVENFAQYLNMDELANDDGEI